MAPESAPAHGRAAPTQGGATRTEHDPLGALAVPADAYYGIHTARALANFTILGRPARPELICALALVKAACARTNAELGFLPENETNAILAACREIASGQLHDWIRVDALQGGAGTSLNMNLNEVIANRAQELLGLPLGAYGRVHPIAQVNLHQSTNDVYPTALKVAATLALGRLEPAIARLQGALQAQEHACNGLVKMGRTQLQDACPTTVGAAFGAWSEAFARDRWRVFKCRERLRVVNLGGTAIGTGLTAPRDYIFRVTDRLREETGLNLARAENLLDATQNADVYVEVSGILKAHAVSLYKVSSDLRLLSSGPKAGFGELRLPPRQAGSSIMPGKVNPVICEAVGQAAMTCIGNDLMITQACQSGQLELNAFLPLVANALLETLAVLEQANLSLAEHCIDGIEVNAAHCRDQVEQSWALVTALVPVLGYDQAGEVAKEAAATGRTIRAVVLDRGLLDGATLDRLLAPAAMTALGYRS
ncbi:aspartate ammonia-lyase [uncultured Lamprocystis sp.]|jgi:aspartate ammonia-lyase|uniref:aspartate ammonia-lyase n=1 Tax=uncultured Lamprocystis sp. TaxID=543132 RepID=UPI0025EAFEAA|nr:aspartate ammonia-lyase [uncultured Lamprocystis sp.]